MKRSGNNCRELAPSLTDSPLTIPESPLPLNSFGSTSSTTPPPPFKKRAESDAWVPDAPARAEKFAQRYTEILEDLKKDLESHGSPRDCILLCTLREQVLRELGFQDIFKKVKDEKNAKATSLFENLVDLNDAIEDEVKRVDNLIRGILPEI